MHPKTKFPISIKLFIEALGTYPQVCKFDKCLLQIYLQIVTIITIVHCDRCGYSGKSRWLHSFSYLQVVISMATMWWETGLLQSFNCDKFLCKHNEFYCQRKKIKLQKAMNLIAKPTNTIGNGMNSAAKVSDSTLGKCIMTKSQYTIN